MFRRELRREERRDVVEVAAVGGMVHETHKEHAEAPAAAPAPPAAPAEPAVAHPSEALSDEQVTELERAAKLKEEGILTDEEFAAEKAKILGP